MGNLKPSSRQPASRRFSFFAVIAILLSLFFGAISPQLALADDTSAKVANVPQNIVDHTKRRSLAEAMHECIAVGNMSKRSEKDGNAKTTADIKNGEWGWNSVWVGYVVSPGNGKYHCSEVAQATYAHFGYNDYVSMYCELGGISYSYERNTKHVPKKCGEGDYNQLRKESARSAYNTLVGREKKRSGTSLSATNNPVLDYAFAWQYWNKQCNAEVATGTQDYLNDGKSKVKWRYKVTVAGTDGKTVSVDYFAEKKTGIRAYSLDFPRNGSNNVSCESIGNTLSKNAGAFAAHIYSGHIKDQSSKIAKDIAKRLNIDNIDKCQSQLNKAVSLIAQSAQKETSSINNDLSKNTDLVKCIANNYSLNEEAVKKALSEASENSELDADSLEDGEIEDDNSCKVDGGMAHIICPLMMTLSNIVEGSMDFISKQFLEIESSLISNDQTKEAWGGFRNLANILFVIAFLVIVFSQVSNVGISNYGIKKLLPRLVILAIVVNLSFYISAIFVDLSNMLGYGLSNMFSLAGIDDDIRFSSAVDVGETTVAVLALSAGGAIALWAALPTLLGSLLVGVVAVIMVILMLIARKAIVLLLVVVSPLAFASMILPNTEVLFKKWKDLMLGMLLLFPIIGLVWGGSNLASHIIVGSATDVVMQIIGIVVSVVPLVAIWPLAKGALNATGKLGAAINSAGGKLQEATKQYSDSSRFGDVSRGLQHGKAMRKAKRRTTGLLSGLDRSDIGRSLGLDRGSYAAQHAVDEAELKAADDIFEYEYGRNAAAALSSNNAMVRVKAIQALKEEGSHGMGILREHYSKGGKITSRREAEELGALKGKDVGLSAFGTAAKNHLDDPEKSNEYRTTLEDYNKGAADLYRGLSTGEKATQVAGALESAAAHEYKDENGAVIGRGGPTAEEAEALINDPRLAERMSGSTLEWYQAIARGSGGSGSGPGSP